MLPDWLIRILEGIQRGLGVPEGGVLGLGPDTLVHFLVTTGLVAFCIGRGWVRTGLFLGLVTALFKEAIDLSVLWHYEDFRWPFVRDSLIDLTAGVVAVGVGAWLGSWIRGRRTPDPPRGTTDGD